MAFWVISVIVSLAFGLLPGIDNFAHIGGFIQGIIGACVRLLNSYQCWHAMAECARMVNQIFLPMVGKANPSSKGRWILALVCFPLDVMLLIAGFVAFYVGKYCLIIRSESRHLTVRLPCLGVNVYGWCSFCSWIDCIPVENWCDSYKD